MKTKNTVRRSKRQLGADASPVELPVRKHQKKTTRVAVTDNSNKGEGLEDTRVAVTEIPALEDQMDDSQIHVEAGGNSNKGEGLVDEYVASEKEEVEEEEEEEEDVDKEVDVEEEVVEKASEKEATTEERVSRDEEQPQQSVTKEKRKRGPTKMRKLAKEAMEKINVEFSVIGEHSGPGSITLSSFLGTLMRTHVSVLVDDWRNVDCATKDTMWDLIQARFNLDEDTHRGPIFKQMGNIWRASKSRLVKQVRKAKTATQRLMLKPSNIQSLAS